MLCCQKCNVIYNYSMFGRKLLSEEQCYGSCRDLVEASDVVYIYDFIITSKLKLLQIYIGIANMHKKYRRQDRDPRWLGHIAAR